MPLRQVFRACLAVGLAGASFISPAMAAAPSVLWAFGGISDDGFSPAAPLLVVSGALYGTTTMGGVYGAGTVFALTPPAAGQTTWTETILHDFAGGNDGAEPLGGGLTLGASGVLYGTTQLGGDAACGCGTVFSLTPAAGGWTETVLYRFTGGADGGVPQSGLIFRGGALYGTATQGGDLTCSQVGCGVVFKLAPPRAGQTAWTETVLHTFAGDTQGDGGDPIGTLIASQAGVLYGTTASGGTHDAGTAFALTPPSGGGPWTETLLYTFNSFIGDAGVPYAGLTIDTSGALYGTTQVGGASDDGAVFRLTPPALGQTAWTETVLYSFCARAACADGQGPYYAGVILVGGDLYGTTYYGGGGDGVIYRLAPPAHGGSPWTETVLSAFNSTDGGYPAAGLTYYKGKVYGTTASRSTFDGGEVFSLGP